MASDGLLHCSRYRSDRLVAGRVTFLPVQPDNPRNFGEHDAERTTSGLRSLRLDTSSAMKVPASVKLRQVVDHGKRAEAQDWFSITALGLQQGIFQSRSEPRSFRAGGLRRTSSTKIRTTSGSNCVPV